MKMILVRTDGGMRRVVRGKNTSGDKCSGTNKTSKLSPQEKGSV